MARVQLRTDRSCPVYRQAWSTSTTLLVLKKFLLGQKQNLLCRAPTAVKAARGAAGGEAEAGSRGSPHCSHQAGRGRALGGHPGGLQMPLLKMRLLPHFRLHLALKPRVALHDPIMQHVSQTVDLSPCHQQRRFGKDAGQIIEVLELWQQHGDEFLAWKAAPPPPPPPPPQSPQKPSALEAVAVAAVPAAAVTGAAAGVAASRSSPSPAAAAGGAALRTAGVPLLVVFFPLKAPLGMCHDHAT